MQSLTREEAIRLHRELWSIVASLWQDKMCTIEEDSDESPMLVKEKVIERHQYAAVTRYDYPFFSCWCCHYDRQFEDICSHCPLDWENPTAPVTNCAYNDNGFYHKYLVATHWITKYYWANRIANLTEVGA